MCTNMADFHLRSRLDRSVTKINCLSIRDWNKRISMHSFSEVIFTTYNIHYIGEL